MDAAGVIATYVLDGDRPLTAETNGNTTFYLYGLGAIGEKTTAWNFSLPDGTNTPRQLTDLSGEITLSARYTPWGDTLETYGTGNFIYGYFGGVLDATTGLLYVGNGQYYDPATGRFLTRDVYPNNTNPYVPWNPIGAIVGPLGLIALVFGRKKKASKAGTFLALLLVVGSAGVILAACGPAPTATPPPSNPTSTPDNSALAIPPGTATPGGALTVIATLPVATASPISPVTAIPCLMPAEVVEGINLSAYYTVLESDYVGGKVAILVTEKNGRRQEVGDYLIRQEELRERVKYTDFITSAQTARSDFLYDPAGVCTQGSGRLENGLHISCVDVINNITGFDWLPEVTISNVINKPLEVVAICPIETSTPFRQGDIVEIPALKAHLQSFGKDEFLTVADTGGGLCATDGHSDSLDVYIGVGQTAYDAHYLSIRGIESTTVNIYRGVVP